MVVAVSPHLPDPVMAARVVVVEADPIVREWVGFKLCDCGYAVEEVADAATALRALRRAPDAVVVDPEGLAGAPEPLVTALHAAAPEAAIIVLSGRGDACAAREAVRAGARGYVSRASAPTDLVGAVRAALDGGLGVDASVLRSLLDPAGRESEAEDVTLSPQEARVLALVAHGLTNREVGARLFLSPHTVKNYLRNAADKLGATTRLDAVLEGSRRGLIDLPPETGRLRSIRRRASGVVYALTHVWMVVEDALPAALWM
jgi:DNA-binding NarL/FixJ family response regulator